MFSGPGKGGMGLVCKQAWSFMYMFHGKRIYYFASGCSVCRTVELVCRLIYKEKRLFIHEGVD